MGHMNIQGVSNKIDQVRLLLESEQNQIHVLGLSETKLNVIHPKEGICCTRRTDIEQESLECIWLEIKPYKSKSFLLGNIY